jgi:hypothetical protein
MARKCFISFKTEDVTYKQFIQDHVAIDMINRSLDHAIQSQNEDYILRRIREDYLADSTVTIHLIGAYSSESRGAFEQRFIKREMQASLYNGATNSRNGILGVVLPSSRDHVFKGSYTCSNCGNSHNYVAVNDDTVVREFSYNYYIPNGKCSHREEDRYCVLTTWDEFLSDSSKFIEQAFAKRNEPIANKVKVYGS